MASAPGQVVYFGDSLTDDGNLLAFAQMIVDPAAIDVSLREADENVRGASVRCDLIGVEGLMLNTRVLEKLAFAPVDEVG